MPGRLGKTATERKAILRNQASELLWYGKIKTTEARAKALQPYVEKIITKAIKVYDDNVVTPVTVKDKKGKESTQNSIKDSPKKLAVRRDLIAKLRDLHEIAPKYAQRKEEKGQGGGYTRIYLLGSRPGDGAEEAIIELV